MGMMVRCGFVKIVQWFLCEYKMIYTIIHDLISDAEKKMQQFAEI